MLQGLCPGHRQLSIAPEGGWTLLRVRFQTVHERRLRRHELLARAREREPLGTIDLGERLPPAGPRRPLHLERVRVRRRRVEVALDRPARHDLAVLLPHLAERARLRAVRERRAELLLDLAPGGGGRIVAVAVLALGDRPGAVVALGPERAARVDEEDLAAAVEEEAGAALRHPPNLVWTV